MPEISVIIPTYNRAHYISDAVESALNQTFKDIEIIVVDDGSTDNTEDVIGRYKERIRYIKTENGGPSRARNRGMKESRGNFIAFLDSDDMYYPEKLEIQWRLLNEYEDVGAISSEMSLFNDDGWLKEKSLRDYHSSSYKRWNLSFNDIYQYSEAKTLIREDEGYEKKFTFYWGNIFLKYYMHAIVFTNSLMFRREVMDEIGYQNEKYRLLEDYEYALRISKKFKLGFVDIPLYKLRIHPSQISNTGGSLDVLIERQINAVKIAEEYGKKDADFYCQYSELVKWKLARLKRALAIPLLIKEEGTPYARECLVESGELGHPEPILLLATYFPLFMRKLIVYSYNKYFV